MNKNVWKVGSRWGNMGESVLDLFFDYECVFFGNAYGGNRGDWNAVERGDLFIVSDGSVPVAIGEALGKFTEWESAGIPFRKRDADEFLVDADAVVCRARLVLLGERERGEYWGIDLRRAFCRAALAAEKVQKWWGENGRTDGPGPFAISTRVVSLCDESDPGRLFHPGAKYHVPIFQRPYSWGEPQIRRLLEDLHQALSCKAPVFLGTMQLSQPIPLNPDGSIRSYDVIDGQQRMTTLLLLLAILERFGCDPGTGWTLDYAKRNFRTSVNKRAAQNDLDEALDGLALMELNPTIGDETPALRSNPYFANARIIVFLLRELASRDDGGDDAAPVPDEALADYMCRMRAFLEKSVRIVIIETRAGLSKTLEIFDTINSSGLDLGSEDLFKVRFYEYRQRMGDGEDAFDRISEIYERVAEYNRHPCNGATLPMSVVLATYQRELVAKYDMNAATFSMSQERFFGELFDTLLDVHAWDDFKAFKGVLAIEDLAAVADAHVTYLEACARDADLRIFQRLFWETRYGYAADFPVLALLAGVSAAGAIRPFTEGLVKALVPPSLYYAKHVYQGRALLLDLLKAMWRGEFGSGDSITDWCGKRWTFGGQTLPQLFLASLDNPVAWNVKWKNLLCRLVEYRASGEKDDALFRRLFETGFDIEHVQSFTDEKDFEQVWREWGDELNRIGNLAMLESGLNRSIRNQRTKKPVAYAASEYRSIRDLGAKVAVWTKDDAIARRKAIAEDLENWLWGN